MLKQLRRVSSIGIKNTMQGARVFGAALGVRPFVEKFVRDMVACWVTKVKNLSVITKTYPQAAYAVFTHGLSSKWSFLMRTIPDIGDKLQQLEDAIRLYFPPAIAGRQALSDAEQKQIALPARLGIPTTIAAAQFRSSLRISDLLASLIIEQSPQYPEHTFAAQKAIKVTVRTDNRVCRQEEVETQRPQLPKPQQFGMDQASEKGASSWLTALPIHEFGFCIHKQAFRNAFCQVRMPA